MYMCVCFFLPTHAYFIAAVNAFNALANFRRILFLLNIKQFCSCHLIGKSVIKNPIYRQNSSSVPFTSLFRNTFLCIIIFVSFNYYYFF